MDGGALEPAGRRADAAGGDARVATSALDACERRRRTTTFLEAVPIPAAIVRADAGAISFAERNAAFVAEGAGYAEDAGARSGLAAFLAGAEDYGRSEWTDGDVLEGRLFEVRTARLATVAGERPSCLVTLLDRTAEVRTQRSLRAELLRDSLTGLPNRAAFSEAVAEATAAAGAAGGEDFAVLILDLARFSRFNECMGPLAGDELIITVARRLIGALRGHDMLARIGGDEFGILLRRTAGLREAMAAAKRVHGTLLKPLRLSGVEIGVDCAVGFAMWSGSGAPTGAEELIRGAQLALKRAKISGGTEIYRAGEAAESRRRFSLESELRRAVENGELSLAFQPLVNLQTGTLAGFEALARWTHPERGTISPAEFVPVAEECGLIVPLGRWALDTALTTLAGWDRAAGTTLPLHVSVNISAIQLARDDVVAMVGGALDRHGIAGARLMLEITESAIIRDPERATSTLHGLKRREAAIAMDDFGTGYSSLAYLQKLPIDVLKIDRAFVTPMLRDRDSLALVRAVLSLADALGMRAVAEGIETVELAQTLAALGCACGQGFHFAPALPADDAYRYWRERSA